MLIASQFANWALTLVKAFLKVSGIAATGNHTNDAIFGMLTLLVVLPSLIAATAWLYGFREPVTAR